MRSIFLFLIVLVLFLLVMAVINNRKARAAAQKKTVPTPKATEKMVSCEMCGTYLPESEAVCEQGKHFCDQQHLAEFKEKIK